MPKHKKKKKKLTSIPVIHRRLFRLASITCRENADLTCEMCGIKKGDIYKGKPQRVQAHHVMSRSNVNSPLKWDTRNLSCLCTKCHKGGKRSAHKHALWFAQEFTKKRPEDAKWILDHTDDMVNIKNREILEFIEHQVRRNLPLDFKDSEYISE